MTLRLKYHFCRKKRYNFVIMYATLLWTYYVSPSGLSILVHGVIPP